MSIRSIVYFFTLIFVLGCALFSQEPQPLQTEYTYVFEKEKNIVVENFDEKEDGHMLSEDSLKMSILRRDMPLVNRVVRFVSTTPDIFSFEGGATSLEVRTDENGDVVAPIRINGVGRGIAVIHLLRITSTATNITHEEYVTLNVGSGDADSMMSIENFNFAASGENFAYYLFPTHLFLAVIMFFVIGYFRRLKTGKEYNNIEMYMIATLLGFSSVKNKEKYSYLMVVFFVIEVSLFYLIILTLNPMVSVFLLLFALVSSTIPKDRAYAVFFTLFAMMSVHYYISVFQAHFTTSLLTSDKFAFMNKWYVLMPFFFVLTAFLSNIYIPLVILSSIQVFFALDIINVHLSVLAVGLAFALFIIKTMLNINVALFYKLNILKVDM